MASRPVRVIIFTPTRGDRPILLEQCKKLVKAQQCNIIDHIVFDNKAPINGKDLGWRIRHGLQEVVKHHKPDLMIIMEDDDYYGPMYARHMVSAWMQSGCPALFGVERTIYYHTGWQKYRDQTHVGRASLCATACTPQALRYANWTDDHVMVDLRWWQTVPVNMKRAVPFQSLDAGYSTDRPPFVGIKHGIGLCGGKGHSAPGLYRHDDRNYAYLRKIVGDQADFYMNLNK